MTIILHAILGAIALLACAVIAEAQHTKKISRIAFLSTSDLGPSRERAVGIRRQLREIGYVEGQNFIAEYRTVGRNVSRELAAELMRLKVDIFVAAGGDPLVRAVKNATKTIPIVMTGPAPIQWRKD